MAFPGKSVRILHVDDEPGFAELTSTFLKRHNEAFEVTTAENVACGLDLLEDGEFDCIVSDYDMPGENGIGFLTDARVTYPDLPFILFTGKGSEEIASRAITAGVSDYLQKESGTDQYLVLANRISNLVIQHRAEANLKRRIRQQAIIADLGQEALAGQDLEVLFENAVEKVADGLDNEYAKVLEYFPEQGELLLRAGIGWQEGLAGEATVGDGADSQAGHTLRSEKPIIVDNLGTEERFGGPPLLIEHGVVSGISVIIGTIDDPWGVLGTHSTQHRQFTQDDVNFVQSVANILSAAIERDEMQKDSN